ncbi:uncharacterized protein LOC120121617 [Hibiscus syriacus]|uniref:uncharacterized protein LOC120121617 n=1 Tax=Hibiscus syriacus TaxID=106335 RepID=UPI0019221305|nr:uncharacterized protein LOC120121617 [Hibiscus syriacus]
MADGYRWSRSGMALSLVGFLLLLQLCFVASGTNAVSGDSQLRVSLSQVEEENSQVHFHRTKRFLQAAKRRQRQPGPATLVDEFLDENSPLRRVFFPEAATAINPVNGDNYYRPGNIWLDTDVNPIQAHGGGVLYDEISSTYYWYGEYRDVPQGSTTGRIDVIGVGCYSSKDLWTWKNEGIVLPADMENKTHDLHISNVLERPRVIYNEITGKYVMWMHIDTGNYSKASVGIAIGDSPTGPFQYLRSLRPHGRDSRDMTVFKDDDGVAYLIYSSQSNSELHIGPLTDDYLDVQPDMQRILVGLRREAPTVFKYQGIYYMITSACTGWAPNEALAHAAESMMGPWETIGDPCIGGTNTFRLAAFLSQSTFVIPLPGSPGSYVFMADRWNPAQLNDSRYVWLPLTVGDPAGPFEFDFGFPSWPRVSIYWHQKWRLPLGRR